MHYLVPISASSISDYIEEKYLKTLKWSLYVQALQGPQSLFHSQIHHSSWTDKVPNFLMRQPDPLMMNRSKEKTDKSPLEHFQINGSFRSAFQLHQLIN